MADRQTIADVFVNAVRDELEGTPNKSHPVQFNSTTTDHFVVCTMCGCAVPDLVASKDFHREYHNKHNEAHAKIEAEARRYKSPPRYG